jgi:hypothetical protein
MKQTAVEWFKEELEKQLDFKAVEKFWGGLYDKAKAMEKQQIIEFAIKWAENTKPNSIESAKQYYKETFKSE